MDSAEFLDLLGNGNRRRILRLLARKPCYVTEISEQLGVSPKAVIDHLEKLEDAGLIESKTDDRRRKYFSIARHVSLEVTVSPYEFGTRSAYPSNGRFDITSCRQVSVELAAVTGHEDDPERDPAAAESTDVESDGGVTDESPAVSTASADGSPGVSTLANRLQEFEELERELSLLHRWAEGHITRLRERLAERVDIAEPRLVSELLVALAEEPRGREELRRQLGVPSPVVEELLELLAEDGIVRQEGDRWRLTD